MTIALAPDSVASSTPSEGPGVGPLPKLSSMRSERESSERDALMSVALASSSAGSLCDVLEPIAEAACAVLGSGSLSVGTWDVELDAMRILINVGDLGPNEQRRPTDETYPRDTFRELARMLRERVPYFVAIDDPDGDPPVLAVLAELQKESAIAVPVVVDGELWGEVWATTPVGAPRFRGRDVRFLEAIAAQLAAVISRTEQFSRVSQMAYEDALTGLPNRRALDEQLDFALVRHRDGGERVALVVCDVDGLKQVNDDRGHAAGDDALRRVGEALVQAAATVQSAFVARLSGDEFAIVLSGFGLDVAREVSGSALVILRDGRSGPPVSLSCGAAEAGVGSDRRQTLLRAADTAQYAAKRRGRGLICTAEPGGGAFPGGVLASGRRVTARDGLAGGSATLLTQLDEELGQASTLDRLEAVAAGFAELLNAAAWAVSFSDHGSDTIRSISTADDRDTRLRGVRLGLEEEVYDLDRFPATAALVRAERGVFVVECSDLDGDPAEVALLGQLGLSAVMATVIADVDGTYLVELFADDESGPLASAELALQLVARVAGAHAAGVRELITRDHRRGRQLAALHQLGARLGACRDEQEILALAVEHLHEGLGYELCCIERLTPDARVELVAARGAAVERLLEIGWSQPSGLGLVGRVVREREVVRVGDVTAEPDYRSTSETLSVGSELCAPLTPGGELWGVIDVCDERRDAFDEHDAQLLSAVADQVAAALRCAELERLCGDDA